MRAAILWDDRASLDVRDDVTLVGLGARDVRLQVVASGICHTDLSVQNGTIPHARPCVLGHEAAGIVVEVGAGVNDVTPGDHVIVASVPMCGKCADCVAGRPNLCRSVQAPTPRHFAVAGQHVPGVFGSGSFAEEMIVSADAVVPVAADLPLDLACLIGCGVMTGVGAAINSARIAPGSSVVVFGLGGVGMAAIQGARIAGAAEILAVDPQATKHAIARRLGATLAVTPAELADTIRALTGGHGFDYALECVGSGAVIRQAFDATRRGGTTVVVGVGRSDDIVPFSAYELFYNEKLLRGSMYGGANIHRDFDRLVKLWRCGKLDLDTLISRRFSLEEINAAFEVVASGEAIRCVIQLAPAGA